MINKITSEIFQLHFHNFGSCIYLLKLKRLIIIDTSSKECKEELLQDLKKLNIKPKDIQIILLTHNHYDHNSNINLFPNAKLYSYENLEKLKKELLEFKIIEVPGHTYDSIAFLYKNILFSGDTLFYQGIGRTDLPNSQPEKMADSLAKLRGLKYKILCPGHIS